MIILRSRLRGRGRFIAKPVALTEQPTGTLEVLKTYEFWIFLPLAKQIYWGVWSDSDPCITGICNATHSRNLTVSFTVITASVQP